MEDRKKAEASRAKNSINDFYSCWKVREFSLKLYTGEDITGKLLEIPQWKAENIYWFLYFFRQLYSIFVFSSSQVPLHPFLVSDFSFFTPNLFSLFSSILFWHHTWTQELQTPRMSSPFLLEMGHGQWWTRALRHQKQFCSFEWKYELKKWKYWWM